MILAIDPGTKVAGWAMGTTERRRSGTVDLNGLSEGAVYARLREWTRGMLIGGVVKRIVIEAPVLGTGANIQSRLRLFGFRAIVMEEAYFRNIDVREVAVGSWRSLVLGVTRAPQGVEDSRAWLKRRAQLEAKARGWGEVGEDEAEALGVLEYEMNRSVRGYRSQPVLPRGMTDAHRSKAPRSSRKRVDARPAGRGTRPAQQGRLI